MTSIMSDPLYSTFIPAYRPYANDFVCQLAQGEKLEGKGPHDSVRVDLQPRLIRQQQTPLTVQSNLPVYQELEDRLNGQYRQKEYRTCGNCASCPLGCHETGVCKAGCDQMGSCQQCAIAGIPDQRELSHQLDRCEKGDGGSECSPEGMLHRAYWSSAPQPARLSVEEYHQCRVPYSLDYYSEKNASSSKVGRTKVQ